MVTHTQTVMKVVGTHIFASWLYYTNFVNLNTGRIDVVRRARLPRRDTNEEDWCQFKAKPMECHRSTIKYEPTTNGHRKWSEYGSELFGLASYEHADEEIN